MCLPVLPAGDERVSPVSLIDHVGGQSLKIIGAQQPDRRGSVKGDVQQSFVELALGQLGRGTSRIYRFADPVQLRGSGVVLHEVSPHGDDPPGIAADLGHISEADLHGLGPQLLPEHPDLQTAHHHQDRVTRIDRPADERRRSGQELGRAGVQQRLVPVSADGLCRERLVLTTRGDFRTGGWLITGRDIQL